MKQIPIFGDGIQSYSAAATAQRRLNCFYDPRPDQDKNATIIRGTPGSVAWISLAVSPIRGWHVMANVLYVVSGAVLYSITTAGTVTYLGTLTTSVGRVEIADNGSQLCIVDGIAGYYFTASGSVFGTIVDANFPNGARTVTFLNGRFIVEKYNTRQFYVGQVYDATLWTPVVFATKENDSSVLLAVDTVNGTLVLWGTTSIEFWQDVGTTPLPFQRINGATQTWGLAAIASRVLFNNTSIFLAQNPQGHVQVMLLNGYTPTRVSTTDIENIISNISTFSSAVALTYMVDGHPMYQLTFPDDDRSLLYDGLTGLWSETQTGTAVVARHFANYGIVFNSQNYVSDVDTGNIYRLDTQVYTDNGETIKRQVRTRHVRDGGNIFYVSELYLDIDTGVGLQAGQGVDPMMMIQVSKDGGNTFGVERQVSMGKVGQYRNPRLITRRWGQSRDFVWQFTVTDPVQFLICSGSISTSGQEGVQVGT